MMKFKKIVSGILILSVLLAPTVNVSAQTDSSGYFLWIDSYSNYQTGYYVNFKSWVTTKESCTIESFHGTNNAVFYSVEGRLTIEYKDPKTGSIIGYISSHSIPVMWFY